MFSVSLTRVLTAFCCTALIGLAAGCGSHNSTPTGVGVGVTLGISSPTGSTQIFLGQSVTIVANVLDGSAAGVVWSLAGPGTLSDITKTTVVYHAPTVTVPGTTETAGATTATITAVSASNTLDYSSIGIIANGTPLIAPTTLLPGNQNIAYSALIPVVGGTSPFTWTVKSGTLPPGLSLSTSGGPAAGISGTPTAINHSPPPFTIEVTDAGGHTATIALTLPINEYTGCILIGTYLFLQNGFANNVPAARAVSITVGTNGSLTGVQDYKKASATKADESFLGQCANDGGNRGHVQFSAPSASIHFNYAVFTNLTAARLIENDGTSFFGVATMMKRSSPAATLATMAGDFVLGLVGSDSGGLRKAVVGRLTLAADGSISAGEVDSNGTDPVAAEPLTGSFQEPSPVTGRGTAVLRFGATTLQVAYYAPTPDNLYLINIDSASTAPRLAGPMNRQVGGGSFGAASITTDAVFELQGATGTDQPMSVTELGLVFNQEPAVGTLTLEVDRVYHGEPDVTTSYPGHYTVAANGRMTLSIGSGAAERSFVIYLDGPSDGLMLEQTGPNAGFGEIDLQDASTFENFTGGTYLGATLFPPSVSPMGLFPTQNIAGGTLAGNISGYYALNPTTGRGVSYVASNILGGSGTVFYLVNPNKIVMMGNGVNTVSSVIATFEF